MEHTATPATDESTAGEPKSLAVTAHSPAPQGTSNRSTTPESTVFRDYIGSAWAEREDAIPAARVQASYAQARRDRVSDAYAGRRLIVPAGSLKPRANDTDYPFRAHTAFAWLTGWGSDSEPGSVLVFEPRTGGPGHDVTLYFRERAGRDSNEFYANPEIGEFWIGPRPSLAQVAGDLGIATQGILNFDDLMTTMGTATCLVRDADAALTERIDQARLRSAAERALGNNASDAPFSIEFGEDHPEDDEFARDLSEFRLVKDDYEIAQLRSAIAATHRGFSDVIGELPRVIAEPRGERLVEGVFSTRARLDGNDVGYGTIAASGAHACILHWTRNDGPVNEGDVILVDAGVETDDYYTADITRTLPVSGTYSDAQRRVYEAVREAADAAFAIVRPGIRFREIHGAAMAVIARRVAEWGLLPVTAEEALQADNQHHRRYMVHGTSHHLGLDVHDCAKARREMYHDGILQPGMVFTIEPGLYFQPDDLTVPVELRGIGVRIEDNILVTADGAENMSIAIPRTADAVEAWVREARR